MVGKKDPRGQEKSVFAAPLGNYTRQARKFRWGQKLAATEKATTDEEETVE
jgi:hypothetical protein